MSEKITIQKIGRKDMPSKFKEGETYKLTTILDEKGRKMAAFGKWAEGWKVGDVIEAQIKEKKWTDKEGFEQVGLSLENPNKQTFTPGGIKSNFNPTISAYNNAVLFAIALGVSGSKKKITLEDLDKIATHFLGKFDTSTTTATTDNVPTVDVAKEEKQAPKKVKDDDFDEEEDDDPF